jgi:hypothetical protein
MPVRQTLYHLSHFTSSDWLFLWNIKKLQPEGGDYLCISSRVVVGRADFALWGLFSGSRDIWVAMAGEEAAISILVGRGQMLPCILQGTQWFCHNKEVSGPKRH